ncbi:MAG: homoserine O-succinyltransferase [Lachnospiraceae bacterium]|nr:homoserine O-succinyltransferase [Lachnospiraceae bacterium]
MPIKVQRDLPAREILENENIFVMDEYRSLHQDIRPLKIVILNLMPLKEDTELQILRSLSNSPLQVDITFLTIESHVSKNTSANHLNQFYTTFGEIRRHRYDGMIITGAPVETLEFNEVDYWEELCTIFEWTKTHVTSTFHICWGAQAGLFYHFGLPKYRLEKKLFGIYSHKVMNRKIPLVRGFDDVFYAPHSRYTCVKAEDIYNCKDLTVCAESEEAGIFLCMTGGGSQIYVMGHPEYDRLTLDKEYVRDRNKGLDTDIPKNYYPGDDPENRPLLSWRSHANNLYTNWLNYYVYQTTPYTLEDLPDDKSGDP